jgi:hypothetical protein
MTCFQNTYKYFGILRTKTGPIFDAIFLDRPKELSLSKETVAADKDTEDTAESCVSLSKVDRTVMTVSELEEKLRETSLRNLRSKVNLVSVSFKEACDMFSSFNGRNLHYDFHGDNFVGNQVLIM